MMALNRSASPHSRLHLYLSWLQAIVELLFFFPLVLITHLLFLPTVPISAIYIAIIILLFLGSLWARIVYQFNRVTTTFALALAFALGVGTVWLLLRSYDQNLYGTWQLIPEWADWTLMPFTAFAVVFLSAMFYRGWTLERTDWEQDIPIGFYWISILLTFALYLATIGLFHNFDERFAAATYPTLTLTVLIISFMVNLLLVNVQQLRKVSQIGKSTMSYKDVLNNQIIVLIIIGLIGVVYLTVRHANFFALLSILVFGILFMFYFMRENVFYLLKRFGYFLALIAVLYLGWALFYSIFGDNGGSGAGGGPVQEEGEVLPGENVTPRWMVYGSLGLIALIALVFFKDILRILRWVYRKLRDILKALLKQLRDKKAKPETNEFDDEKITLDAVEDLKESAEKVKAWLRGRLRGDVRWRELANNQERIRYIYRQLVLRSIDKGFHFRSTRTPHETLRDLKEWTILQPKRRKRKPVQADEPQHSSEELRAMYDRVRYGELDVEDEIVQRLKDQDDQM